MRVILNETGEAYLNADAALEKASAMTNDTGELFTIIKTEPRGYAVISSLKIEKDKVQPFDREEEKKADHIHVNDRSLMGDLVDRFKKQQQGEIPSGGNSSSHNKKKQRQGKYSIDRICKRRLIVRPSHKAFLIQMFLTVPRQHKLDLVA